MKISQSSPGPKIFISTKMFADDHFWQDPPGGGVANTDKHEVFLEQNPKVYTPVGIGEAEILAHIIPARGLALGTLTPDLFGGELNGGFDMQAKMGLTNQSYDHSAQMLGDYAKRKLYWETLLATFDLGLK